MKNLAVFVSGLNEPRWGFTIWLTWGKFSSKTCEMYELIGRIYFTYIFSLVREPLTTREHESNFQSIRTKAMHMRKDDAVSGRKTNQIVFRSLCLCPSLPFLSVVSFLHWTRIPSIAYLYIYTECFCVFVQFLSIRMCVYAILCVQCYRWADEREREREKKAGKREREAKGEITLSNLLEIWPYISRHTIRICRGLS